MSVLAVLGFAACLIGVGIFAGILTDKLIDRFLS